MHDSLTISTTLLAVSGLGLAGLVLLGLAHCFLGYVLFRLTLLLDGAIAGWVLGQALLVSFRPAPGGMDLFVAGVIGGILLALSAWYLYKLFFALGLGALSGAMLGSLLGWPATVGGWVVAVLVFVLVSAVVYGMMRKLVILLTAVGGAFTAVFLGVWGATGQPTPFFDWLGEHWLAGSLALLGAGLLSAAGYWVQSQSPFLISDQFSPRFGRRGKADRGSRNTNVRTPFSRL